MNKTEREDFINELETLKKKYSYIKELTCLITFDDKTEHFENNEAIEKYSLINLPKGITVQMMFNLAHALGTQQKFLEIEIAMIRQKAYKDTI